MTILVTRRLWLFYIVLSLSLLDTNPPASFQDKTIRVPRLGSRVVNSIQNLEIRTEDFKPARGLEMTLESSGSRPVQPA